MKEQPLETHIEPELVMREMLLHDVYELPFEPDDLLATCSCCGEPGPDGPVCPEVPN